MALAGIIGVTGKKQKFTWWNAALLTALSGCSATSSFKLQASSCPFKLPKIATKEASRDSHLVSNTAFFGPVYIV